MPGNGEVRGAPPAAGGRVRLLDNLRGFSVVSMVAYHAMFDLVYLFGVHAPWYSAMPGYLWQQSICWVFILVSGAAQHYGSRPVRRGLIVLGCALLVTLATAVALPSQRILFGVLHFLGCAMLLAAALRPLLRRVPAPAGLAVCFLLFLLTKGLPAGFLGMADVPLWHLPQTLYSQPFLFPLGLPAPGFASGDYFPLIPWFFLFLAGWFGWALLKDRLPKSTARPGLLGRIGQHSLLVYVLHQPVIYGVLLLLDKAGVFGR